LGDKNWEREVRGLRFRLPRSTSCGFDFVNPLDLKTSALVMVRNCLFARRVEDTVNSVLFLIVQYVVVGHAKLVFWGVLQLF